MITISTNKGLVKIETWEDVLQRPGFDVDLDPDRHQLDTILGKYVFGDKVRCGLSNCHTLHARGYLVATKTGRETNIGKDCGKTYFGVDFEHAAKQFESDYAAHQNRELLWSFSFQTDDLEAKIAELRGGANGADWVNKYAHALTDPAKVPTEVTRQIGELIRQKSGTYTRDRMATAQEAEDLEVQVGRRLERPVYVTDYQVTIKGIEALYPEHNLRELIMVSLLSNLKDFKALSIDDLGSAELVHWKKWVTSVDHFFETAVAAVEYGQELLTKHNLEPLRKLSGLEKDNGLARLDAYLAQLK